MATTRWFNVSLKLGAIRNMKLTQLAREQGLSKSDVIRAALDEKFTRHTIDKTKAAEELRVAV